MARIKRLDYKIIVIKHHLLLRLFPLRWGRRLEPVSQSISDRYETGDGFGWHFDESMPFETAPSQKVTGFFVFNVVVHCSSSELMLLIV